MQTVKKPDWYTAASENLDKIEKNLHVYENEERIKPTEHIIDSVRAFLKHLFEKTQEGTPVVEPKFFVSPNGQIVATLGTRPQCLSVTFGEEISFICRHPVGGVIKGTGLECPVRIALEHFRTL